MNEMKLWKKNVSILTKAGVYEPKNEHSNCGVGLVAAIDGKAKRSVVDAGITALKALWHRGAVDADGKTGDGAGLQVSFPQEFFKDYIKSLGVKPSKQNIAVGMFFLPRTINNQENCRTIVEKEIINTGNKIYCWRSVPINLKALGKKANETRPEIEQIFIENSRNLNEEEFEKELFILRRKIEKKIPPDSNKDFYICSLSSKSIVYKGMFLAEQIDAFYPDLNHKEFTSNFAIFHQRYSTNTFPTWSLAQPFRVLSHNGEINTIQGNTNWAVIHAPKMFSKKLGDDIKAINPIIQEGSSDSAALDSFYELLLHSGKELPMIKCLTIPESNNPNNDSQVNNFYKYCNAVLEPWDGPAAITAFGGDWVIAGMDRNGFRPMRYSLTNDNILFVGSETGMVDIESSNIVAKGHVPPGQVLGVNLKEGKFYSPDEIKKYLITKKPYDKWIKRIKTFQSVIKKSNQKVSYFDQAELRKRQIVSGWNTEDLELILDPMILDKKEAVGSMGDDTPITLLSKNYRGLHTFFRQNFSQVTNPPMDSLRETNVMTLNTRLGNLCNILEESESQCNFILHDTPFLFTAEYEALKKRFKDKSKEIQCLFNVNIPNENLEKSIKKIQLEAEEAVRSGVEHLLISDKKINADRAPIPMVLAVGAIHTHLVKQDLRSFVSINVQSSDILDVHSFAILIGVGATTVNPYLAEQTIHNRYEKKVLNINVSQALENYKSAINSGILKIMSKMGISVLSSYRAGYNFEAVGLNRTLVADIFPGMPSRISGLGYQGIEKKIVHLHFKAFNEDVISLPIGGFYKYRKSGENHYYQPNLIHTLQNAVYANSYKKYKIYSEGISNLAPINIRDLFEFKYIKKEIALTEVEPEKNIYKRFGSGSMSHGALSKEAHETLAIAMNRIGASSCSGEGGEDPKRFIKLSNGDNKSSKVKQIASGRFGVTADYLNHCEEIEIKMAQGAKPGEGGQLPGFKVTSEIASLRHSTKGVTLISPPPHHDIYSIEDLAQLIYDLKQINPIARVCVKLVARSGIGTIAAGVAKAKADTILISGHSGGTGASPQTSIKYAGIPWELGLSEVHQILVMNNLRHKVCLRTDGGIKTGRDIIIASILGAEEYGIGTTSLVAMGCILVRQCHSDVCPVGICTQKPELRKKFEGSPEKVVNLFSFIAREAREILSKLGFKSINDIIGRTDLLRQISRDNITVDTLDLNSLLVKAVSQYPVYSIVKTRNEVPESLDKKILNDITKKIKQKKINKISLEYSIKNTNRAIGTRLSSFINNTFKKYKWNNKQIQIKLKGSAGQSLGAFLVKPIEIVVEGDANDYVGKGLSGGTIIIKPKNIVNFKPDKNIIIGNTVLYGATSGELFINGQAGERFAVRNSGANAVIEGCSNNGCEYMTGGKVVILGRIGENFAAGMTGGMAFIYDTENIVESCINQDSVIYQKVQMQYWENILFNLITKHIKYTQSPLAKNIIENWKIEKKNFWQIIPLEILNLLEYPISVQHKKELEKRRA